MVNLFQVSSCPLDWGLVWKPRPHPTGASKIDLKEVFGQNDMTMTLYERNSTVVWKSKFDITVSCPMRFTSFPFDKQRCNLEIRLPEIMTPRLLRFSLKDSLKDTLGYNVQV